mgnify:CR=1 FL=1
MIGIYATIARLRENIKVEQEYIVHLEQEEQRGTAVDTVY